MPPSPPAPTLPRRAFVALVVAGAVSFAGGSAWAQVPTTTAPEVLVPGDSTPPSGAPATTAAESSTPSASEDEGGVLDFDFDANEKVWIIVGGLVAIAILMLVLTIVYWRHTRPDRAAVEVDDAGDDDDEEPEKPSRRERRAAKRDPFAAAADTGSDETDDEVDETDEDDEDNGEVEGPADLDEVPATPDPARSVFGGPEEPEGSSS